MNNKIETVAKVLTIAFLGLSIIALVMGLQTNSGRSLVSIAIAFIVLLIRFAIGYWMYTRAERESKYPWMWCLLGLTFGIITVGVYFLIDIHETVCRPREKEEQT